MYSLLALLVCCLLENFLRIEKLKMGSNIQVTARKAKNVQYLKDLSEEQKAVYLLKTNKGPMNKRYKHSLVI